MGKRLQLSLNSTAAPGIDGRLAVVCRELPADGSVPEEIQILPAGLNVVGRDGRSFKNPNPQRVVEAQSTSDSDIFVDFDHDIETMGSGPAAGWVKSLEAREDGSMFAKVEWTPRGAEAIRNKEYRYISPAFFHADGDIFKMSSIGLTNRPNLDMPALNAEQGEAMNPELLAALGLDKNATEEQAIEAAKALNAAKVEAEKLATSSAQPSIDKFVPRQDYDVALNRASTAEAKLAEREEAEKAEKIETALNSALKAGKITPATVEYHRAQCAQEGGLERFAEYVKSAPAVGEDSDIADPVGGETTSLNAQELKIIEQMGITPEQYLAAE